MTTDTYKKLITVLNEEIEPLVEGANKYNSLMQKIGDARIVLLGEASHGTYEFYKARAEITRELIIKKGFMSIAIEGDWPDSYHIHRYLHGIGSATDWQESLKNFKRFPAWMWRNAAIPPFLQWLREYNDELFTSNNKIGFYGLDLYSLQSSMQAVIDYLTKADPEAAERAKKRYACFDHLNMDPQTYGYLTAAGIKKSCIKEAIDELLELQHHTIEYIRRDGLAGEDEHFFATQNARVVKDAENYYRAMFETRETSWNLRDTHMAETLNAIANHLENRFKKPAKIVIWAHNSHVGDARATEMRERGEINLGQLIREQYDTETYSIGFSTYEGTVTAASDWGAPAECKFVNPGLEGSYEELFHQLKYKNFLLNLTDNKNLLHYLQIPRLQRAIGVIYRPEMERFSHYFFTHLPFQFDSLIHFDHTNAVCPLEDKTE